MNPPPPRTNSILPLCKGNHWVYTNTIYDANGVAQAPLARIVQHLTMPEVYGVTRDTVAYYYYNEKYGCL